ncbi:MAG: hypothetical protein HYV27_04280 [Candidatus Hydrogenedentes bacterium]|nr:hypothetical protein [Candidatus Hydrogenedentota bacterium]
MASCQMIDMLKRGEQFHHLLADYYENMENHVGREDVKMVLDYMRRHEEFLAQCFRDYEEQAPRGITQAWFKVRPDDHLLELLESVEIRPDVSVDEVVRQAMRFDEALIGLYRQLSEVAVSEQLREALEKILLLELQEEKKLTQQFQY